MDPIDSRVAGGGALEIAMGGSGLGPAIVEVSRGNYLISTDRSRLDARAIHAYLTRSYWGRGIPLEAVGESIAGSLCFGLYLESEQVGLARVITDATTFAYLCDVYVLEEHRGKGLSKWLVETVLDHPSLRGLRRFVLVTRDAHGLYRRYGFRPLSESRLYMEIVRPAIYGNGADGSPALEQVKREDDPTPGSTHMENMNLIEQLEFTKSETLRHFDLSEPALGRRYAPDKWTVRELLHHLCDAETVLFDRIRRVISEPRPVIWAFDQDAWAVKLGYAERPLALSRAIYEATRAGVIYYARLHYRQSGRLEFVHSETGVRTLKDEFEKVAVHNRHHLDQIRLALEDGA
jgi:GNAT superfamily N-acetyltransferase